MTQDEAAKIYSGARQVIEQQKREAIELAKRECNLRQEQYRNQLKEAKHSSEQAELAEKIKQAESYKDEKIQEIEKEAGSRLAGADSRLKENVEQHKQREAKQLEEKARQDVELRQKGLGIDGHQKQRDELDKNQERTRQEVAAQQAREDTNCRENLQKDIDGKHKEIETRRREFERQKELGGR